MSTDGYTCGERSVTSLDNDPSCEKSCSGLRKNQESDFQEQCCTTYLDGCDQETQMELPLC